MLFEYLDEFLCVVLRLVRLVAENAELRVVLRPLGATHLLLGELQQSMMYFDSRVFC